VTRRYPFGRVAGVFTGASLLAACLAMGGNALAFSGNPNYYDIGKLTALAQRAANTLYEEGIMNGTGPGEFSPYGTVTRAQAVKFIVNALRLPLASPGSATYADVSPQSQYYPYIEAAVKAGILTGMAASSGDFNPSTPITRADFAVLSTNALGDQALANSLANNTTKYGYLKDLGKVPAGDLGAVNAMMQVGIIPPYDSHLYAPLNRVNREEFAVAIMRLYNVLAAAGAQSVSVAPASGVTAVGQADQLSVTVRNGQGQVLSGAALAPYSITYQVVGSNSGSAGVSSNGSFLASAAGTYTVQVTVSGAGMPHPVTGTAQIQVYGAATALKVMPKSTTIVADRAATDTIQVDVVDASGNLVGTYNGNVTLSDTNSATELVGSSGATQSAAVTVQAQNGVATFTIQSTGSAGGQSDTLTASANAGGQNLTNGTATITTQAQQATSIRVTPTSAFVQSNTGGTQDAVGAVVEDQAGQPMLSGTYGLQFSLSGPGQFLVGGNGPISAAFVANGTTSPSPASETVMSQQGASGTITVTVTGAGLTSGTATIKEGVAGAPASMQASAAHPSVASGTIDPITVQLSDASGNPTTTPSPISLTGTVASNGQTVGTLTGTIGAGSGNATLNFDEQKAGTYTVSVAAAGFATQTLTITVGSGNGSALSLTPGGPTSGAPVDLPQGQETVTVSSQLQDSAGNPVALANIPVTFSASGGSGSYTVNGGSGPVTVDTNAQGIAQASFNFGTSTGTWTVTSTSPGYAQATQTFSVVSYAAQSVEVHLNQTGSVTAGSAVTGTITALQPNGTTVGNPDYLQVTVNPQAALSGVKFTDPNNGGAVITPVSSVNGTYLVKSTDGQIDMSATAAQAGALTVTATDESVASAPKGSAALTVQGGSLPGGATAYDNQGNDLGTNALSVSANQAVPVVVKLTDGYGNDVVSSVPVTVVLKDTNTATNATGTGAFRSSPTGANYAGDEVVIPAGTNSVTVYYVNASAGSYDINASTPGLATAVSSTAGAAGQGTISLTFGDLSGNVLTADTQAAHWTVEVNGQALSTSAYTVSSTGSAITFTLASGYQSGKSYSVSLTGANTSHAGADVPLSISPALFLTNLG